MTHRTLAFTLTMPGILAAVAVVLAASTASAQTPTSPYKTQSPVSPAPANAGNLTTASSPTRKPSSSATAEMINEAIQRSEARAARFQQSGVPEQFGSEEPFTYDPAVRKYSAAQQ